MPKFKLKYANLVKEVGTIAVSVFEELFHEFVSSKIKNPQTEKIIDISLLRWLCNTLENSLDKRDIVDEKVNKKQLVLNEYFKLKPNANNDTYRVILDDLIEDLHNTRPIKKLDNSTKLYHRVKSCCVTSNATK
jgi:hypothetical protein